MGTYTNTMRLTGLSGIDTESMVTQLMKAESMRMNSLKQTRQKTTWKQEAYRAIAASLQTFQNTFLDFTQNAATNLLSTANYSKLASTVMLAGQTTESTAVKASGGGTAKAGTYSLRVEQIAKADKYESAASVNVDIVSNGFDPQYLEVGDQLNVRLDNGAVHTITFTEEDLQGNVVDNLNTKLGNLFGSEEGNQKVYAKFDDEMNLTIGSLAGHTVTISNTDDTSLTMAKLGFSAGPLTNTIDTKKSLQDLFGVTTTNGTFKINGKTFNFDKTDSLEKIMKTVNDSGIGVNLSFDSLRQSFKLESTNTGTSNAISFSDPNGLFKNVFKIVNENTQDSTLTAARSHTVTASNAVVNFNGLRTTRESNTFTIDGINISLTNASVGYEADGTIIPKEYEIKVDRDVSGTVDMIKKFVEEYNKLVDEMNKAVTTTRPKSGSYSYYEPLTEEEESALSDKQVERWEEKAKTGMLYRDSIIQGIATEMRSFLYQRVTMDDGSSIALYEIGVTTQSTGGAIGKLQIDEEKLTAAINENPDAVMNLFTKDSGKSAVNVSQRKARLKDEGLALRLSDIIKNAIGVGGSIYEQAGLVGTSSEKNNALYKSLSNQDDTINTLLKTLQSKETRYYEMFSKLETAMNSSNNQMSALQSMLGL